MKGVKDMNFSIGDEVMDTTDGEKAVIINQVTTTLFTVLTHDGCVGEFDSRYFKATGKHYKMFADGVNEICN